MLEFAIAKMFDLQHITKDAVKRLRSQYNSHDSYGNFFIKKNTSTAKVDCKKTVTDYILSSL